VNTSSILIAGLASVLLFSLGAALVVAVTWMARYFKRRDQRDRQNAENEGRDARQRGEPSWSNPYKGEASDHFKNLAQAWDCGYDGAPKT